MSYPSPPIFMLSHDGEGEVSARLMSWDGIVDFTEMMAVVFKKEKLLEEKVALFCHRFACDGVRAQDDDGVFRDYDFTEIVLGDFIEVSKAVLRTGLKSTFNLKKAEAKIKKYDKAKELVR